MILCRNGFALLSDLESPDIQSILCGMEAFQARFIAQTRGVWNNSLGFSPDCLSLWSRQWEYPYCYANMQKLSGKVLDAGSGFTFFPYFLAGQQRYEVDCCDVDKRLESVFQEANAATGLSVKFRLCSIADLSYPDSFFDMVCCVSVMEHIQGIGRIKAMQEFLRVLKPGGRLVLTCDISLGNDCEIPFPEFALLLHELESYFEHVYPLALNRPPNLLTTEYFRSNAEWRLPWWRISVSPLRGLARKLLADRRFFSLAVIGLTLSKPL